MTMTSSRAASSRTSGLRSAVARIAGDASAEVLAERSHRGDPVARIEMVVGDDDVGRAEFRERGPRLGEAVGGRNHAAPSPQENAHALQHARLIVDGQNFEPVERFARRGGLGAPGSPRVPGAARPSGAVTENTEPLLGHERNPTG